LYKQNQQIFALLQIARYHRAACLGCPQPALGQAFEGQNIIRIFIDNLMRDGTLTPHGINAVNAGLKVCRLVG
jgi:hypothetical protein